MRRVTITMPVYLPGWLYRMLQALKYKLKPTCDTCRRVNLLGDRDIEWSWVAAHIGQGPGKAIDFGCGPGSSLGLIAACAGFEVTAVDLGSVNWHYIHHNLKFRQGDILKLDFPDQSVDLIINCSAIEHVGLAGRYGVTKNRPDGDLEAMARLRELMKPGGGVMLLTIPVGQDAIFPPLHRVYGEKRLPKLLEGYVVKKKEYWVKDEKNCWVSVEESVALSRMPRKDLYGLGCFVLRTKGKSGYVC